MKTYRWGSLFAGWLLAAGLAQAVMYKWVDENGVTQYSQFPPPGREAQRVAAPPRPAEESSDAQKKLDQTLQGLEERRKARTEAEEDRERAAAVKAQRQENCALARRNLEILTSGGNRRIIGDDGVARHPTQEEREARVAQTRDQIKEYCD